MTVKEIADQTAFYLQQSRAQLVDSIGNDMVITAMNNAVKAMQQQHDFLPQQAEAWMTLDPVLGASLSSAYLVSGDTLSSTLVNILSVDTVYLKSVTSVTPIAWYPLWSDGKKLLALKNKERAYLQRTFRYQSTPVFQDSPLSRYPTVNDTGRPTRAFWVGRVFFLDPRPTDSQVLKLDCVLKAPKFYQNRTVAVLTSSTASTSVTVSSMPVDLIVGTTLLGRTVTVIAGTTLTLSGNANATIVVSTATAYSNASGFTTNEAFENWITDEASEYLMWAAVCEVNQFTGTYVIRAEGYNPPPEKQRDKALARLIEQDNFQFEQSRQPLTQRWT